MIHDLSCPSGFFSLWGRAHSLFVSYMNPVEGALAIRTAQATGVMCPPLLPTPCETFFPSPLLQRHVRVCSRRWCRRSSSSTCLCSLALSGQQFLGSCRRCATQSLSLNLPRALLPCAGRMMRMRARVYDVSTPEWLRPLAHTASQGPHRSAHHFEHYRG